MESRRKFQFTAVYGLHTIEERTSLWTTLITLDTTIGPWLIMGDFNSILLMEDKEVDSQVQEHETRNFKNFVEDCHLSELPSVEISYTWTKGHVYSRIDKAIVNAS